MKTIALIASLMAIPAFAGFKVSQYEQTQSKVFLQFMTEETYPSICRLPVQTISITSPEAALAQGLSDTETGIVDLTVGTTPETRCFHSDGVHNGSVTLDKGEGLPRLGVGETYLVKINGQSVKEIKIN